MRRDGGLFCLGSAAAKPLGLVRRPGSPAPIQQTSDRSRAILRAGTDLDQLTLLSLIGRPEHFFLTRCMGPRTIKVRQPLGDHPRQHAWRWYRPCQRQQVAAPADQIAEVGRGPARPAARPGTR